MTTGPTSMTTGMMKIGKSTIMYSVRLSRTVSRSSRAHTARTLAHTVTRLLRAGPAAFRRAQLFHPIGEGVFQIVDADLPAHLRRRAHRTNGAVDEDGHPVAYPVGLE